MHSCVHKWKLIKAQAPAPKRVTPNRTLTAGTRRYFAAKCPCRKVHVQSTGGAAGNAVAAMPAHIARSTLRARMHFRNAGSASIDARIRPPRQFHHRIPESHTKRHNSARQYSSLPIVCRLFRSVAPCKTTHTATRLATTNGGAINAVTGGASGFSLATKRQASTRAVLSTAC